MEKSIKYAIYAVLTLAVIMLGTAVYWLQYYNLFSLQEQTNGFIGNVENLYFRGLIFVLWSLGDYPAGSIAFCAAASAAILAFFWLVETKLFKDRKWAFLTAPLATSAILLAFALGGSIVSNQIETDLYNAKPSSGCIDILYNGSSFDSFLDLPANFSMLILETALAVFLSLIFYGVIRKKGWNKFLVVSALLLILAQFVYFFVIPIILLSLILP
ncbi:MAG TPA: hypothetical protein P5080_03335 [Candidatus Paceibacterota bacterium]|nr:hypothetical protein [Candidatus Pacearchaeota archaeon]HRZ51001.1 hypothetical protein [Candidatus Paceibacterota bacterium]HSA36722.1 hypothetical protein [Candidatus Paceibacterota bacterium]